MLRARTVVVYDGLDTYINQLSHKTTNAVRRTALDIRRDAKIFVPVDTGFLKNTIVAEPLGVHEWEIAAHAYYAQWVEFGHRVGSDNRFLDPEGGGSLGRDRRAWVPAQPFMLPAAERNRTHFIAAMRSVVGSI